MGVFQHQNHNSITHHLVYHSINSHHYVTSPPLAPEVCIFGYIPLSRRWDTVRYSDTARYS